MINQEDLNLIKNTRSDIRRYGYKMQDLYTPVKMNEEEKKLCSVWTDDIVKLSQYIVFVSIFAKIYCDNVVCCLYRIREIINNLICQNKCNFDKTEFYYLMMYSESFGVNFEFIEEKDIVYVLKVLMEEFEMTTEIKNYIEYNVILNVADNIVRYMPVFKNMLDVVDESIEKENISIFDEYVNNNYNIEFAEDINCPDYKYLKKASRCLKNDEIVDSLENVIERIVHLYISELRNDGRDLYISKMISVELACLETIAAKTDSVAYRFYLDSFDILPSFVYKIISNSWVEYTNYKEIVEFVNSTELLNFETRFFEYLYMIKEIIEYFKENFRTYLEIEDIENIFEKYLN